MHRGTIVVNSKYVDAIVMYTGVETKIVLNQGKYHFKQSRLDKAINWITVWNMFLIFVMAGFMTARASAFLTKYRDPQNGLNGAYYIFEDSPDDLGFKAFGSFYLLFNQFIPFELLIIIEMVKMYYTSWIESDIKLHNIDSANSVKV